MITNTHTKTIKVHTLVVDDTEIEHYQKNPDEWIDLLSTLLTAQPQPNGNGEKPMQKKSRRARPAKADMINCPKCGMLVKQRGLLVHQHGSKCRPQNAPQPAWIPTAD